MQGRRAVKAAEQAQCLWSWLWVVGGGVERWWSQVVVTNEDMQCKLGQRCLASWLWNNMHALSLNLPWHIWFARMFEGSKEAMGRVQLPSLFLAITLYFSTFGESNTSAADCCIVFLATLLGSAKRSYNLYDRARIYGNELHFSLSLYSKLQKETPKTSGL